MIKAYETQKVGNSMINAIVEQEIKRQKDIRDAELKAQNDRLRMHVQMQERRIDDLMQEKLARDYCQPERGNALGVIWWALVGWTVLAFGALFDALGV